MTTPLITLQGVYYTPPSSSQKNTVPIIEDINLTLNRGAITTLIGPNGAGKTTLLKLILGLLSPTSGVITRHAFCALSYMPQKLSVPPLLPLTVRDFLNLTNPHFESTPSVMIQKLGDILNISPLLSKSMHHLSGGEQQKILFFRCILSAPNVLILDEPAQGVDMGTQRILYESMNTVRNETGCAILMVSHDIHMVMAYCDHVICLNRHICCHGSPHDIRNHPEYTGLFAGHIPPHIAPYHHDHDHIHDDEGVCTHTRPPTSE